MCIAEALDRGPRGLLSPHPLCHLNDRVSALLSGERQQRERSSTPQTTNPRPAPPSRQSHDTALNFRILTALNFRILQNMPTGQCASPRGLLQSPQTGSQPPPRKGGHRPGLGAPRLSPSSQAYVP